MRVALPFILAIAGMTEAQPVVVAAELYDEDGWRVRIALRDGDALWCVAERVDPPGRCRCQCGAGAGRIALAGAGGCGRSGRGGGRFRTVGFRRPADRTATRLLCHATGSE